ncbi:MAG TPA: PIN domain nuclease [Thermoanaerobaculia bacterium]|nr:PIN domain nuclease [Thermoanaerobaculia bacterium]
MVLVDSSIWIAVERGKVRLADLVAADEMVAACPAIAHEVLRGTRSTKQYQLVSEMLRAAEMLDSPTTLERFEEAARIYRQCRDAGITPSAIDCLIAACAMANHAVLLHQDRDFDVIAGVLRLNLVTRS